MSLPNFADILDEWEISLVFVNVVQTTVDYQITNNFIYKTFKGAVMPLKPEAIALKPECQRSWSWFSVHTRTDLIYNTNDRIIYNNDKYKIMHKSDYSLYGVLIYHIVKDFD